MEVQALAPDLLLLSVDDLQAAREPRLAMARMGLWTDDDAQRLLNAEGPWHAPVIEVIRLHDALVLVSALPTLAPPLTEAAGLSREARGMLLADLADAAAEEGSASWCWRLPDVFRVDTRGGGRQLRILPTPADPEHAQGPSTQQEAWTDAGRTIAWLVATQLFGLQRDDTQDRPPPETLLPEAVISWCAPWWGSPPPAQGPDGDALMQSLQLGHTSRRAPVLTAADTLPGGISGRHWRKARTQANRSIKRQSILLALVGCALALIASPLLFQHDPADRASAARSEDRDNGDGSRANRAPDLLQPPHARGPLTTEVALPRERTTAYTHLRRVGPMVVGVWGELDRATAAREAHVRVQRDTEGRVQRIEHYGVAGTFLGYETLHWQDDGMLTSWRWLDAWGNALRTVDIDPTARSARVTLSETPSPFSHCTLVLRGHDSVQGWDNVLCLNAAGHPIRFAGGHHAEERTWSEEGEGWQERVVYLRDTSQGNTGWENRVRLRTFDALGRLRTEAWTDAQGNAVIHPDLGASQVRISREEGAVRTRFFDLEGAPTVGRQGWHERRWAPAPGERGGEFSFHDLSGNRISLLGTEVAGWSERWTSGWPTLRVFLGEHRTPAVDAEFVHRRTWVRDDRGTPLVACSDGLEGAASVARWHGAHCLTREQDERGRVREIRFYDRNRQPRDGSGLVRVLIGYDSSSGRMNSVGYERGDGSQDGPVRGSWRRAWFFDSDGLPTEEFWFPGASQDLHQTAQWHVLRRFNDEHQWERLQAFPSRLTRGGTFPERSDWLEVRRLGLGTDQLLWEIESGALLKWFSAWSRFLRMGRATVLFELDVEDQPIRIGARSEGFGAGPAWPRQGLCALPVECPDPEGVGGWYAPTLEETLLRQRWPGELPAAPPYVPDARELPERRVLPGPSRFPNDPW